jgi:hypothetical protein
VADRTLDDTLQQLDDLIHQSERLRQEIEAQLRRRPSWPERARADERSTGTAPSPDAREPSADDRD